MCGVHPLNTPIWSSVLMLLCLCVAEVAHGQIAPPVEVEPAFGQRGTFTLGGEAAFSYEDRELEFRGNKVGSTRLEYAYAPRLGYFATDRFWLGVALPTRYVFESDGPVEETRTLGGLVVKPRYFVGISPAWYGHVGMELGVLGGTREIERDDQGISSSESVFTKVLGLGAGLTWAVGGARGGALTASLHYERQHTTLEPEDEGLELTEHVDQVIFRIELDLFLSVNPTR